MEGEGSSLRLEDLPEDIVLNILRCVTRRTGSPTLALVSRHFSALLPQATAGLCVPRYRRADPQCITGALLAYRDLEMVALEKEACTDLSDQVLDCVPHVRQLSLSFARQDSATEERLQALLQRSTHLSRLKLHDWSKCSLLDSIVELPHLRSLSLRGPGHRVGLQDALTMANPALEHLDLECESLEAPQDLSVLSHLRSLSITCADVRAPLSAVSSLTALSALTLRVEPASVLDCNLGPLTLLRTLTLATWDLEALPEGLGELRSLKSLSLQCCLRSGDGYSVLGRLDGLTSLLIGNLGRSESWLLDLLQEVSGLSALQQLAIHCEALPRGRSDLLNRLPALVRLTVHCQENLQTLEPPGVTDAPIVSAADPWLLPCSLQELDFKCSEPGRTLAHLRQLTQLRQLRISVNSPISQWAPPAAAFELPQLEVLNLCGCEGLRTAPLGSLKVLRQLALEQCPSLVGISAELSSLVALEELRLVECGSSLEPLVLPDVFVGLTALRKVTLLCPGMCTIPESLVALGSLGALTVSANIRAFPNAFHSSCELRELSCIRCPQLRTLPSSLSNLTALAELHVTECRSMREIPKAVFQLRALRSLEICLCPISRLSGEVGNLRGLSRLAFDLKLRSLPDSLSACQALKDLQLWDCRMRKLPTVLGSLPELQSLELNGWPHLNALPVWLAHVTSLRELYFFACPQLIEAPRQLLDLPLLTNHMREYLEREFNLV